jgi:hypothetical protein
MAGLKEIWRLWFGTLAGEEESFEYKGDVYDTPPLWIRFLMAFACLFGYVLMLWYYHEAANPLAVVWLSGGFLIASFLVFTVPRAGQTAIVTVLFWGLLGGFAIFWPI